MIHKYQNLALLVLRLGLAVTFFRNGWEAWEHTQEMVERVAMSGWSPLEPTTLLTLIGIWDFAIALLLVLGLWTKRIAIPATLWIFVVILVVAKVNGAEDVFDRLPYLATAFSLIFLGGGEWTLRKPQSRP
jgi:uncharacterized membrane protein YphA (DoxX/SURF4 family)